MASDFTRYFPSSVRLNTRRWERDSFLGALGVDCSMATKVKRKVKKVEAPKITDGAAKVVGVDDGAARTSPAVKVTKARNRTQQKRSFTPWLIGAGVVLLIAVPTGINVYRQSQLPGERFVANLRAAMTASMSKPNPGHSWSCVPIL